MYLEQTTQITPDIYLLTYRDALKKFREFHNILLFIIEALWPKRLGHLQLEN
jgi:hypothetical protein